MNKKLRTLLRKKELTNLDCFDLALAALRQYATHSFYCRWKDSFYHADSECTCGLNEAIARLEERRDAYAAQQGHYQEDCQPKRAIP